MNVICIWSLTILMLVSIQNHVALPCITWFWIRRQCYTCLPQASVFCILLICVLYCMLPFCILILHAAIMHLYQLRPYSASLSCMLPFCSLVLQAVIYPASSSFRPYSASISCMLSFLHPYCACCYCGSLSWMLSFCIVLVNTDENRHYVNRERSCCTRASPNWGSCPCCGQCSRFIRYIG